MNESEKYGKKIEDEFENIATSLGWKVTRATSKENILKHFDFAIEKDGKKHKVDVKGLKRVSRSSKDRSKKYAWLELQGVTGYPGWLKGKADFFAVKHETEENRFDMYKRESLVDYVRKEVDLNKANNGAKKVKAPDGFECWIAQHDRNKALYALYTRATSEKYGPRYDLISLINLQHLKENVKHVSFIKKVFDLT